MVNETGQTYWSRQDPIQMLGNCWTCIGASRSSSRILTACWSADFQSFQAVDRPTEGVGDLRRTAINPYIMRFPIEFMCYKYFISTDDKIRRGKLGPSRLFLHGSLLQRNQYQSDVVVVSFVGHSWGNKKNTRNHGEMTHKMVRKRLNHLFWFQDPIWPQDE